jgi:hypothetical protein
LANTSICINIFQIKIEPNSSSFVSLSLSLSPIYNVQVIRLEKNQTLHEKSNPMMTLEDVSKINHVHKSAVLDILMCLGSESNTAAHQHTEEFINTDDDINHDDDDDGHDRNDISSAMHGNDVHIPLGELTFADMPWKIHLRSGMAVVYEPKYVLHTINEEEDSEHDSEHVFDDKETTTLHALINKSCEYSALLRIYATELSFAERNMLPLLSYFFPITRLTSLTLKHQQHNTTTSKYSARISYPMWLNSYLDYTIQLFGDERGYELFYQSVLVSLIAIFILFVALVYLVFIRRWLNTGSSVSSHSLLEKKLN